MGWEMSLEDVQEDEDDEEIGEENGDENMEDNTVLEAMESQELCEVFKVSVLFS